MSDPTQETQIWRGSPSQWINFGAYFVSLLVVGGIVYGVLHFNAPRAYLGLVALPVLFVISRWLRTSTHVYELTTERVRETTGMFSRRTSELELYRVRDYTVVEPLLLRLVGRGDLILNTADRTTANVVLHAIPQVNALKDQVRTHTERMRRSRGVRDLEIDPQ